MDVWMMVEWSHAKYSSIRKLSYRQFWLLGVASKHRRLPILWFDYFSIWLFPKSNCKTALLKKNPITTIYNYLLCFYSSRLPSIVKSVVMHKQRRIVIFWLRSKAKRCVLKKFGNRSETYFLIFRPNFLRIQSIRS